MKKKKNFILSLLIVACLGLIGLVVLNSNQVEASQGGGGQVIRGGKITFYEESSSSIDTSSSTEPSVSNSSDLVTEKPKGRLPSTGELVKRYGWIGGVILLLSAFLLFMRKHKKEEQQ